MSKKIFQQIVKALFLTLLFLAYNLINILADIFDWTAKYLQKMCYLYGIYSPIGEDVDSKIFESKFTEKELETMAQNLPSNIERLDEIQNHYSVSYRQARKIKSIVDKIKNSPDVRRIYA